MATRNNREDWITRQGQSLYDLAIQLYGDITNLGKVLSQVSSLEDPTEGRKFTAEYTDDFLATYLFSKKLVATLEPVEPGEVDNAILREDGGFLLREDGGFYLRE